MTVYCLALTSFFKEGIQLKEALKGHLSKAAVSVMHLEDVHSDEMPLLEALSELRRRADFMIADVSELNANVIFEIGRAFESGMDIVLVAQEHAAIPMALDSAPMVWYRQEEIYSDEFAASILSAFKKLPRMTQKQNSLCS